MACYQKPLETGLSFNESGVGISSEGCPYLGAAIGLESYIRTFVADKIKGWCAEVRQLSRFAESQPHATYCAFTHGLSSHWLFASRMAPTDCDTFHPLEDLIR